MTGFDGGSYSQRNFNPAKLVRAVNHLMPMGKERAILELRNFLDIAMSGRNTERVDDNIDTSDATCVFLILHLLFECEQPNHQVPRIVETPYAPLPSAVEESFWPMHPVHIQNDLPFLLTVSGTIVGLAESPLMRVEWAEKYGKIRTTPYRPVGDPMAAAEQLIALPQTTRLFVREPVVDDIFYQQAWNILEQAAPDHEFPELRPRPGKRFEMDWEPRKRAAAELNVRWSETENRYVVEKSGSRR